MARGVKSNFRASCIVSVTYMSSVCALTEVIYKNVSFDKQHPLLASIQCHSNTTTSLAMLNIALTLQFHSNTTILQYPNVNSLDSSLGRNNFRSRSPHARQNFTDKYSKGGVAFRGADVARLLQHLLGEDEVESGVSLQSPSVKTVAFPGVDVMSVTVVRMTVARQSLNKAHSVSHQRNLRRHKLKGP